MISMIAGLQIAGTNAAIGALALSMSLSPKATDHAVYVIRPPWVGRGDLQRRIASSGGISVATGSTSIVTMVVLPDAKALSRLLAKSGTIVIGGGRSMRCASNGTLGR